MEGRTLTTDGRVARRQRNENTVLDAVIGLFDAGRVEPAVEDVSELSGVSTRSIYRYFHHREGLIDAAVWHLVDRVEASLALPELSGPLEARIAAFVGHRLAVFARIAPLVRASKRLARPLSGNQQDHVSTHDAQPAAAQRNGHSNNGHGNDGNSNDVPSDVDGQTGQRVDVQAGPRSLFAVPPSIAFAGDFERVDLASRKVAEITADVMFQFDALDGLAQNLAADSTMMAAVLERHLGQQFAPV